MYNESGTLTIIRRKNMIITIANSKGGVGKTSLSSAMALDSRFHGFGVATNETFTLWDELIDEERFVQSSPLKPFGDFKSEQLDVIFDLSGDVTEQSYSISSATSQSNVVVIPTFATRNSIFSTVNYIQAISEFNQNFIIVANALEKQSKEKLPKDKNNFEDWTASQDYQLIKSMVTDSLEVDIPVLPIKSTKAFASISKYRMSIPAMMESSHLHKFSFREVDKQLNDLYNEIAKYE